MVLNSSWCRQCSKEYSARFRATDRGRAYDVYRGMLERCYNPKATRYEKYGGAGVVVCNEWLGDEGFNTFFEWYKLQPIMQDKSLQLDKDVYCNDNNIKPHKYSPITCQFISRSENQRNYSDLLRNNTSGYTGVTLNKNKITWNFRLHIEGSTNINRGGFTTALEAAKARETCIIANHLNYKLEHVGSCMLLTEKVDNYTYYSSSNFNNIRKVDERYTGVVTLYNGKRKSIGRFSTEREAATVRNELIHSLNVSNLNSLSHLFGYGKL